MERRTILGYENSCGHYADDEEPYRYLLNITLTDDPSILMFVMLNPSQAGPRERDGTVTRCLKRAQPPYNNFGKIYVTNVFPLITPYPRTLKNSNNRFGPENNYEIIQERAQEANVTNIVCAWGANGSHGRLAEEVTRIKDMLHQVAGDKLQWFGGTARGQPRHPLGLAYAQNFEPWEF